MILVLKGYTFKKKVMKLCWVLIDWRLSIYFKVVLTFNDRFISQCQPRYIETHVVCCQDFYIYAIGRLGLFCLLYLYIALTSLVFTTPESWSPMACDEVCAAKTFQLSIVGTVLTLGSDQPGNFLCLLLYNI